MIAFNQDARIGRIQFLLQGKDLTITPRKRSGLEEIKLSVDSLDPNYTVRWERWGILWQLPLAMSFLCLVVGRYLLQLELPWPILGVYSLVFMVQFLVMTVRGLPPVEFIVFSRTDGSGFVRIVRERRQTEECNEFIKVLIHWIQAENVLIDGDESPQRSTVTYAKPDKEKHPFGDYWLFAILAGLATGSMPFVAHSIPGYEGAMFMLYFMSMLGTFSLSLVSFLRGENLKWWSLVGVFPVLFVFGLDIAMR